MIRILNFLLTGIVLILFLTSCTSEVEKEKKVLFILLDGISADVIEEVDTPNLDNVIGNGSYSRAYLGGEIDNYSESPTVSAVGYNHLLTGVWSNKHNVYGNDIENPNYNYWNIFRLFKNTYPERKTAVYSSWLDNRTKLIGDGLAEAGDINIDISYDGFEHDTLTFPHQENGEHVQDIDQHISELASQSIREEAPGLSWVYLWYTDTTGHIYGDSEEYFNSIKVADQQIGLIWEAVQYREENYNEDWLFLVTTDHGRRLPDGKHHGEHSERERTTWIISNKKSKNRYFTESKPAIVDIYPTISNYLNLNIPLDLDRELDGVPLIDKVSVSHPKVNYNAENKSITVNWQAWQDENVQVLMSKTNEFESGGADKYVELKQVASTDEEVVIDVTDYPSDFYKIIVEGENNTINKWVLIK